jgi:hypothetical protein
VLEATKKDNGMFFNIVLENLFNDEVFGKVLIVQEMLLLVCVVKHVNK